MKKERIITNEQLRKVFGVKKRKNKTEKLNSKYIPLSQILFPVQASMNIDLFTCALKSNKKKYRDTKIVYIAGKITGMEQQAYQLFELYEKALKQKGYIVANPMKLNHEHDKKWSSYMRECISCLMECDKIFLMHNWVESKGAKLELSIANSIGIDACFDIDELPNA